MCPPCSTQSLVVAYEKIQQARQTAIIQICHTCVDCSDRVSITFRNRVNVNTEKNRALLAQNLVIWSICSMTLYVSTMFNRLANLYDEECYVCRIAQCVLQFCDIMRLYYPSNKNHMSKLHKMYENMCRCKRSCPIFFSRHRKLPKLPFFYFTCIESQTMGSCPSFSFYVRVY